MKHNKLFIYRGQKVYLKAESYANNGTLAVCMYDSDGNPYDVITKNLGSPLQSDTLAFLDTNNNPGIDTWLEKNGLGASMNLNQQSGFCSYPLFILFTKKFRD